MKVVSFEAMVIMATSCLILSTSALSLSGPTGGIGDAAQKSSTSLLSASSSSSSLHPDSIVSNGSEENTKKCTHDHRHNHHDETTSCSSSGDSTPTTVTMVGGRTLTLPSSQKQGIDLVSVDLDTKEQRKEEGPSVIIPKTERPDNYFDYNEEVWSNLSPLVWKTYQETQKGIEMKCQWNIDEDLLSVARIIVQRISSWFAHSDDEGPMTKSRKEVLLTEDVLQSMLSFKGICETNLNSIAGYRIKVSAMYGDSCTRCPAYHTDYVPMRWIQTLYGPGCVYVDPLKAKENMFIQRIMENGITKSAEWKARQVKKSGVKVEQTQPGQPVVLVGHAFSTAKQCHLEDRPGVLHRSPHNAAPDQGRVLLTLDVDIANDDDDDNSDNDNDESVCNKGCCS